MTTPAAAELSPSGPRAIDAPSTAEGRGLRWSRVGLIAAALVILQGGLRAWIGYRGYFFLDDFAFTGMAADHSLTDLHSFLLHPYNSHLMPGAFVEVWVLTALWPLNFSAVMTVGVVLQVGVAIAFFRLLTELFGNRPAVLVPFALFLFTPITLPAFVWWAAALNQLPQQLALIGALWCQVRYLRTGRTRVGVLGAAATLGGLLFSEKTLLTVPLVAVFTLFWFARGNVVERVRTCWTAHWRVWTAYLAIGVPYAGYYLLEVPSPGRSGASGGDVLRLVGSSFGHALDPGLLGGPWAWRPVGFVGALADPGPVGTWVAGFVVAAIVVGSVAWYRNAVYGWLLGIGYALLALVLLAVSRATFIGPLIGDEYRYVTDVAAVAVIGGSLAMLRTRDTAWETPPARLERRAWPRRYMARQSVREIRQAVPQAPRAVVIATIIVMIVVSSTVSTIRYDRYWSGNPGEPYLTRLRADVADAPADAVLYDQEVPAQVAWALLFPYNQLSKLLAPLPDAPTFLRTGQGTSNLITTDDQGHLRRTWVDGIAARRGTAPNGCGWRLGSAPRSIPLTRRTFGWTWVVRIGYLASGDTTTRVRAGATTATVSLHAGFNAVFVQVVGAIDHVEIGPLKAGVTACTNDIVVGQPRPIPGTTP